MTARALSTLASRAIGRRLKLTCGCEVTVTRVTGHGLTVKRTGVTAGDIRTYLD